MVVSFQTQMKKTIQILLLLGVPIAMLSGISQTPEAAGRACVPLCVLIAPAIYSIARGKESTWRVILLVTFAWIFPIVAIVGLSTFKMLLPIILVPIVGLFIYGYAWYVAIKSPTQAPAQKIGSRKIESFDKIVPELNLSSSYVPTVTTKKDETPAATGTVVPSRYYAHLRTVGLATLLAVLMVASWLRFNHSELPARIPARLTFPKGSAQWQKDRQDIVQALGNHQFVPPEVLEEFDLANPESR
jgi:hypothetical protein